MDNNEEVKVVTAHKDHAGSRMIQLKDCTQVEFPFDYNGATMYTIDDFEDALFPTPRDRASDVAVLESNGFVRRSRIVKENPDLLKITWTPKYLIIKYDEKTSTYFRIDGTIEYVRLDLDEETNLYKVQHQER